jgi:ArsR family transcriptional regulator
MTEETVAFARALADETRQHIMVLLCCRELCVSEIVAQVDIAQPTVSHHLQILKTAGLVDARRQGKQVYYTLNQERIAVCCGRVCARFAPEVDASLVMCDEPSSE